jgi:hypothetical protein
MSRTVVMRPLKDDSGRVCVHWFRVDPAGPISTQGRTHQTGHGELRLGGVVGWIACNPRQNTVQPQVRGSEHFVCLHTIEAGPGVTCPECRATSEFLAAERQNLDNSQNATQPTQAAG